MEELGVNVPFISKICVLVSYLSESKEYFSKLILCNMLYETGKCVTSEKVKRPESGQFLGQGFV